jgi:hypothetical protein
MDLTTNGVVISDAIKLVQIQTSKEKLTMSKEDDKEPESGARLHYLVVIVPIM